MLGFRRLTVERSDGELTVRGHVTECRRCLRQGQQDD
jgi:hypothetical protein